MYTLLTPQHLSKPMTKHRYLDPAVFPDCNKCLSLERQMIDHGLHTVQFRVRHGVRISPAVLELFGRTTNLLWDDH